MTFTVMMMKQFPSGQFNVTHSGVDGFIHGRLVLLSSLYFDPFHKRLDGGALCACACMCV